MLTLAGGGDRSSIARLIRPRSIAILGVSTTQSAGSLGGTVLDNLDAFGFAGEIHLVHPRAVELGGDLRGRPCVATPRDLPRGIDCVVLAVPVAATLAAVRDCAAQGVGGVIVFAAGFAELGDAGRVLQEEIAAIAAAAGMAIEGPNCLGHVNYLDGVPLTFAVTEPRPLVGPGIAVISQSGAMASVFRAALQSRGLDVAFAISTGNEAACGIEDFIAYLIDDPETRARIRVLAIVAEHIRAPQRFLALVASARGSGIAVLLLHPGRSVAAAAAAATHSGAITGDHAVMTAMVTRAGVTIAATIEELVDCCDCLIRCAVRPRGGTAVLGESGAFKALVLDYAAELGLDLPPPTPAATAMLDAIAPGFIVASNPLDLTAQALGDPGLYARAIEQLLGPDCGCLLVTIILTSAAMAARKMPPVLAAMRAATATHMVVFAMLGEDTPIAESIIDDIRAAGIPFFRSPERALRAIAAMSASAAAQQAASGTPHARVVAPDLAAAADRLPGGTIAEHRAKDLLAAAGLPMPVRRLATDETEAAAAAESIGWPVALKLQSAMLSHKTDVGGVVLNVGDPAALRAGWTKLAAVGVATGATIDGVLVEAMSPPGVELILGARRDVAWGPVLVIGFGGVVAELLSDVRILAADCSVAEIRYALDALKGRALLNQFRGRPACDIDAVVDTVAKLGAFVCAHPEVGELDVNPLRVFAAGRGVLALDALIESR